VCPNANGAAFRGKPVESEDEGKNPSDSKKKKKGKIREKEAQPFLN